MNLDELSLAAEEMAWFRSLVLGDEAGEKRLLGLVRGGLLQQAVRTDPCAACGPLRLVPELRVDGDPTRLRTLELARGADRVIALDAAALGESDAPSLLDAVFSGAATADPPWLAARSALDGATRWLRVPLQRLFPDGGYALIEPANARDGARVIWARMRAGALAEVGGAHALGADAGSEPQAVVDALRERVPPLHLVVSGSASALRALVASSRPASALERARIRDALSVQALSPRFSLSLFALRLVGC